MKEAYLYEKLKNNKVRCKNCSHYCLVLPEKRGICGVKENIKGRLCAINYAKCAALNVDPIEKKPFFHFLPGSLSLSVATVGCNLNCPNCQNFDISQQYKNQREIPGQYLPPKELVKLALKNKVESISYTYVEPTIFLEYALDIIKLAKKKILGS